jgi:hypothetical protein
MVVRQGIVLLVSVLACCLFFSGATFASSYQHSLQIDQMRFDWSIDGANLAVRIAAPTTGWVAVGFNPTDMMKDANIIIGYVKNGKVEISDDFGTRVTQHSSDEKKGGASNVTVVGGSESGATTTLEFIIPLNSGDANDGIIDPQADTKVMFAYGPDRDSMKMKHTFAKTVTINLGSGAMQ